MNGLIRFSLGNPYAITVLCFTVFVLGILALTSIPIDILPAYKSPAVQVLTFYGGMPASNIEKDITARMERWTGQAAGTARQESRSIVGASIIRNYYRDDTDPSSALTQVNSLATAAIPNLPPGTLPPVILPFDPTSTTPVCLVALNSKSQGEAALYDAARYQVRNFIMASPGAVSPVVYGGRIRAILAYLDRTRLQARNLAPLDVMRAIDNYNIFLPTGDAKFGNLDYALDSNSMYELVERMGDIPIKNEPGNAVYLRDVADPRDASLIQTNIVRVDGRRQVYIPVYRQLGTSTLAVVNNVKNDLPDMKARLTTPDIDLKVVMDQSVYVRHAIESLAQEGVLGAILCSLVILVFLGEWRMTVIAVLTIPVSVLAAIIGLYACGQSINVMTLAGLALAIGPLVDSAVICLENTHRHLGLGAKPKAAAFLGASEVAMPELVASCCTLLVLAPLALMPGLGAFLFKPMALAVTFSMVASYLLSRTLVPSRCAYWLKAHHPQAGDINQRDYEHRREHERESRGPLARLFARWESVINGGIAVYLRLLALVMKARLAVVLGAFAFLMVVLVGLGSQLRREFFPEVDAGAFEIAVRCPSGTRIEVTEQRVQEIEKRVKETLGEDLDLVISELGLVADWSAAYTANSGPMDAVLKVQLKQERQKSTQEYVNDLRQSFAEDDEFSDIEFAFDAGGMIRGAMNEGKSTPINVRITSKDVEKANRLADKMMTEVKQVPGVVDCRVLQRLDYPQYIIEVDRAKAADLGLTQTDIMQNLVAALNSSIQFNKRNFWIDPVSHNQYYVGVQYPEKEISSLETLLDVPINSPRQRTSIPLRNVAQIRRTNVPAEISHTNLAPTIDLTMGVYGRDLGHVADDVEAIIRQYGRPLKRGGWTPFDPDSAERTPMEGSKLTLSGEYQRMQDTFRNQALGMILAVLLIYCLMVSLFKSYLTPLVILFAVPFGVVGVVLMLFITGTALNVQSLLGVVFMVGIVVSNTVLLTDFASHLQREERLSPTDSIVKAASIRVRPVVMTATATLFALIPMSLGLERGSEANVPLGRAVLGGLLAGLVTTLLVVPALYSLMVRPTVPETDESSDLTTVPHAPVA